MSPAANTVPSMASSSRAVASSSVVVQSAMSPAPTSTLLPPDGGVDTSIVLVAGALVPAALLGVRVTV